MTLFPINIYNIAFFGNYNLLEVITMYQHIQDLRNDKDLNQTQIANILGMSQTGYSKYETGMLYDDTNLF